jgi:outer membrane protein
MRKEVPAMKKPIKNLERIIWVSLTVALAGALTLPHAQNKAFKLAFVDSQKLLAAHPQGKEAAALRQSAQTELTPLQEKIRALQAKAATGSATAAERQSLDTLGKTYQATAKKWQEKIDKVIAPITKDVDAAVNSVAQDQGIAVVLDAVIAGPRGTGLVVYADLKQTDLTDDVEKKLSK